MGTATMARKKGTKADAPRRPTVVTIKGTEEWKRWLDEAATHCRMGVSTLIDLAVTNYVKSQGFDKRPPER